MKLFHFIKFCTSTYVYCQHQLKTSHIHELPDLDAEASFAHKMDLGEFPNSRYAVEKTILNVVFSIKKKKPVFYSSGTNLQ